jgi:hypothetical protein
MIKKLFGVCLLPFYIFGVIYSMNNFSNEVVLSLAPVYGALAAIVAYVTGWAFYSSDGEGLF